MAKVFGINTKIRPIKLKNVIIELKYSQCLQKFLNYKHTYENRNNRVIA